MFSGAIIRWGGIALSVAIFATVAILYLDNTRLKHQVRQAQSEAAELKAHLIQAHAAAQLREDEFNRTMETLRNDLHRKDKELSSQRALASDTTKRLLQRIALLDARKDELGFSAGGTNDARVARELLGNCAQEYTRLASEASRLKDKVTGLQTVVRNSRAQSGATP